VSDPGLLLSVRGEARRMVPPDYALVAATVVSSRGSKADAPSLDPVPQELAAIIEARFTAGGASLTAH
jgi:hypothetical protein